MDITFLLGVLLGYVLCKKFHEDLIHNSKLNVERMKAYAEEIEKKEAGLNNYMKELREEELRARKARSVNPETTDGDGS
jgi:hypothetical protein